MQIRFRAMALQQPSEVWAEHYDYHSGAFEAVARCTRWQGTSRAVNYAEFPGT